MLTRKQVDPSGRLNVPKLAQTSFWAWERWEFSESTETRSQLGVDT
jgi:hypothetical protein